MGILNKSTLSAKISRGSIRIEPLDQSKNLGEHSIDLHSGSWVHKVDVKKDAKVLDAANANENAAYGKSRLSVANGTYLYPGTIYLMETLESIGNRSNIALLTLNQHMARLGVLMNTSVVEVGAKGKLILPLTFTVPIKFYAGIPIVRLQYFDSGASVRKPYDGHHNNMNLAYKIYDKEDFKYKKVEEK